MFDAQVTRDENKNAFASAAAYSCCQLQAHVVLGVGPFQVFNAGFILYMYFFSLIAQ